MFHVEVLWCLSLNMTIQSCNLSFNSYIHSCTVQQISQRTRQNIPPGHGRTFDEFWNVSKEDEGPISHSGNRKVPLIFYLLALQSVADYIIARSFSWNQLRICRLHRNTLYQRKRFWHLLWNITTADDCSSHQQIMLFSEQHFLVFQ